MQVKTKIKLIETFDGTPSVSLTEDVTFKESCDTSRVDGKYIIGMIEGQFFQPDGMSRNKRWYPRSLWENALNNVDVKNRFLTSTMFGEIGHSDGPVEDMTLRTGCASHFIDKLWIDEKGRGMGRAYILNTPTGQLLKTYLGAGCKLKVSTRGEGTYKENETHEGCPIVDDETYELQTADFVINPGFLETSATLRECYETTLKNISTQKESIQDTIKHVSKEGEQRMGLDIEAYVQELKEELKSAKAEIKSLSEELKAKEKELLEKQFNESAEVKKLTEEYEPFKKMKVSAKTLNEAFNRSKAIIKKTKDENAKLNEELAKYRGECGSLDELHEATELSAKILTRLNEYKAIGTVEEIKGLVESAEAAVKKIQKVRNSDKEIKRMAKQLKEARALETAAKKAFNVINEYKKLVGTLEDLKKSAVKESVVPVKKRNKVNTSEAIKMAKKFGCTVESAAKLIRKHGVEKATTLIESATRKQSEAPKAVMAEGKELVEKVAQLDDVKSVQAEKSAKDFLTKGMVKNYFNHDALGKEIKGIDLNDIDGTASQKTGAAKELLKKYKDAFEVEKADVKVEAPKSSAEAEAEAKKILKNS